MKLEFVYKIIPIPVFYKDSLVRLAGRSFGVFIAIKEEHKNNEAILQHELVHCRQFYRTLGFHGIMYHLSESYRLKAEIEAYKITITHKGYTNRLQSKWIVDTLKQNYKLDVSRQKIEELLYD